MQQQRQQQKRGLAQPRQEKTTRGGEREKPTPKEISRENIPSQPHCPPGCVLSQASKENGNGLHEKGIGSLLQVSVRTCACATLSAAGSLFVEKKQLLMVKKINL